MEHIQPLGSPVLRKKSDKPATRRTVRAIGSRTPEPNSGHKTRDDIVRIIPLGGVEEVGKNMTAVEFRDSIVIVDIGVQFTDEDETPGVDYIIPDTTYLEARKKKIKAVLITHGHLDHIGGIPYVMDKIGNPRIYTRLLTSVVIKKRQVEFPQLPPLDMQVIETNARIKIADDFYARFFNVTHTIPDAMGIVLETPLGNIVFTGDLKVDHDDGIPIERELEVYSNIGKENNLALLADSTNADVPGFSFSERAVHKNIEELIKNTKGRLIVGTFASLLERMIFIIKTAEKYDKRVAFEGRSMKTNIEIAKELGLVDSKSRALIATEEIDNYPPDKVIVMATGAQGDKFAALMRMSMNTHKKVKLHKGDTIILSSSIIPGNERAVQHLKDNLARRGAKVLHYRVLDVHASGHANREELKWLQQQIKPRFFIPIHGPHQFLTTHRDIAIEAGTREDHVIVPDNGSIIEFHREGGDVRVRRLKDSAVTKMVMVDALGTGDVKDVVVRDRKQLAQDGIFVVIATIDLTTGRVRKSPDIISRGFVYLKESQELLKHARGMVKRMIEEASAKQHPLNIDYIKNDLREKLSKFLLQKTGKRPIVLPVILEV
ncbi:MAG TPA: ribonuclease J [Candidatus Paceibacterota bacterium]